jgi:hypothetical protein
LKIGVEVWSEKFRKRVTKVVGGRYAILKSGTRSILNALKVPYCCTSPSMSLTLFREFRNG